MGSMSEPDSPELSSEFRQLLETCRWLYVSGGELLLREYPVLLREYPDLFPRSEDGFAQLMDDLHRALLVKVFVTIWKADRRWSWPKSSARCATRIATHWIL